VDDLSGTHHQALLCYAINLHSDSIKSKPNCLCHKYLTSDHIRLKLSSCLENSTNNMIPKYRNILLNRYKDTSV